ncbi:MAG: DUF1080 domain-containing protein [Candidatus Hydrogenedentota bacterium]
MKRITFMTCFVLLALLMVPFAAAAAENEEAEPADDAHRLPLAFNGKDFSGWVVPDNNIWWKAEDGILKVESGPEKKGSTLWTEKKYGNFVMEFEFKMGKGTVDTGIYVRNSKEQIQIGISGSLKRDMTGSPYIAGKGYPVEAEGVKELLKLDDWNEMTIVAQGKNYAVWLNDAFVMTYDSESAVEKGPIGIQLHGGKEMTVDFRDIRIATLD